MKDLQEYSLSMQETMKRVAATWMKTFNVPIYLPYVMHQLQLAEQEHQRKQIEEEPIMNTVNKVAELVEERAKLERIRENLFTMLPPEEEQSPVFATTDNTVYGIYFTQYGKRKDEGLDLQPDRRELQLTMIRAGLAHVNFNLGEIDVQIHKIEEALKDILL